MKQRGFSAARRPNDANKFALLDFQIDILQGACGGTSRIGITSKNSAQRNAFFSRGLRRVPEAGIRGELFAVFSLLRQIEALNGHSTPTNRTAE
jgi:hypothetical protein